MINKKTWLDELHYNHDKQQGKLELAYAYKDKEGTPRFSKWKKYLDVQSDDRFLEKVNNRTILPNEVVLDIENPEEFPKILESVKKDFDFYSAYKTGSRGYHIHLWFNENLLPSEKLEIIKKYRADEQKASERCMIALENCPHWKTGNLKTLIEEKKGLNKKPENRYIKILKNYDLLELINKELDKKIVKEFDSRKVIFLIANMRNVENLEKGTDNLVVNALSGTGKDHITESIFELLPLNEKEELVKTTPKVLSYTRNLLIDPFASWKKTTLRLEDVGANVINDDSFKVFLSANPNKVNHGKTVHKGKVLEISIEGKPSIILTLANASIGEEQLRRLPHLFLDEGVNQTKEILKRQAKYAVEGKSIEYDSLITESLKFLKRIKVRIPYAESLVKIFEYSTNNVIVRTAFPRFLDYIKSSASLHQFQRKVDDKGNIIANERDYELGVLCLEKTTSNILMIPLSKLDESIYDIFKNKSLQKISIEELFDLEEIQRLGNGERWIRRRVDFLVSKGFLSRVNEKEEGINKPIAKYSFNTLRIFLIPSFEELMKDPSNTTNQTNNTITSNDSNKKVNEVFELNETELTNTLFLDSGIKEDLENG